MIYYNTKNWRMAVFRFHKADTFRALLPMLLLIVLYSAGIVFVEMNWLKLGENSHAKNITIMHSLLGFAISMLLVFRTNTAYDRWWEGRKLWGNLVNTSRNLALKLQAMLPADAASHRGFFRQTIPLYAQSLKQHLLKETTQFQLDEIPHPELANLDKVHHVPNKLAEALIHRIQELRNQGIFSSEQLLVLYPDLNAFTDICGACERIKNTPIPYSYSTFLKKFIVVYVATLPFGLSFILGYMTLPVTAFIFYVLGSLELIAEEIEDPFGSDTNDLPMQKLCDTIRQNIQVILHD